MNKIDEIKQALVKATPGPWWNESGVIHAKHPELWTPEHRAAEHVCTVRSDREDEDAHLIANAPEWLRYLIGEVELLRLNAVTEYAPHDIEQMEELIEIQQQEIERLRKALEWYTDASWTDFEYDNGERARQALGREANL